MLHKCSLQLISATNLSTYTSVSSSSTLSIVKNLNSCQARGFSSYCWKRKQAQRAETQGAGRQTPPSLLQRPGLCQGGEIPPSRIPLGEAFSGSRRGCGLSRKGCWKERVRSHPKPPFPSPTSKGCLGLRDGPALGAPGWRSRRTVRGELICCRLGTKPRSSSHEPARRTWIPAPLNPTLPPDPLEDPAAYLLCKSGCLNSSLISRWPLTWGRRNDVAQFLLPQAPSPCSQGTKGPGNVRFPCRGQRHRTISLTFPPRKFSALNPMPQPKIQTWVQETQEGSLPDSPPCRVWITKPPALPPPPTKVSGLSEPFLQCNLETSASSRSQKGPRHRTCTSCPWKSLFSSPPPKATPSRSL